MEKSITTIGWSRLLIVVLMIVLGYVLYRQYKISMFIGGEVLLFAILVGVVIYHNKIINNKIKIVRFLEINEKGVKRINGEFRTIEDDGSEYIDDSHPFSSDIDIFGKSSLFQLINDTLTKGGRERLVSYLSLRKLPTKESVEKKQEAIKELGEKISWRQELLVKGKTIIKNKLKNWMHLWFGAKKKEVRVQAKK